MAILEWLRRRGRASGPLEAAAGKARVEERHGRWTAHNVELAPGVWTLRDGVVNFDEKTRRAVQVAHDFFGTNLSGLRVLDVGAGEGGLSLEFAAHGAEVVCVEGRESNLAKARFAAEVRGERGISFRQLDVRRLGEVGGTFDLVLCFGLLYHLEADAAVGLLEAIGHMARRVVVVDTHYSLVPGEKVEVDGVVYSGRTFREFPEGATESDMLASPWSSIGNDTSFWFTRPSLLNLLSRVGFSTVYEVAAPLVYDYFDRDTDERYKYRDRTTFVGVKGAPAMVSTSPRVNELAPREWPEDLGHRSIPSPIDR